MSVGCAAGTSVNTFKQTSDSLQYLMNNKFIMYCSCLNSIVKSFFCEYKPVLLVGDVITQHDNSEHR